MMTQEEQVAKLVELAEEQVQEEQEQEQEGEEQVGEDEEQEQGEQEEQEVIEDGASVEGEASAPRSDLVWLLFTGNILVKEGLAKYYGQMLFVAGLVLLSIIVMFWSLHLDMEYNSLVSEVQLMRERSVRLQEVRFSRSSHSTIVEECERRGLQLQDPTTPVRIIERGFW